VKGLRPRRRTLSRRFLRLLHRRKGRHQRSQGRGRFSAGQHRNGIRAESRTIGSRRTVVIDGWFNSQQRTDAFGQQVDFHYKWNTWDKPGYSLFGHLFREFGAQTKRARREPTLANLKGADVYVIASPDNLDKNPHPHFANAEDATQLAEWVKAGGVLVIMENDTSFADLDHFNVIGDKFGIHFNSVLRKHVIGTNWEQGRIDIDGKGPIFHHPHTIYVKDVCTITVTGPPVSARRRRRHLHGHGEIRQGNRHRHDRPLALQRVHRRPQTPRPIRQLRRRQRVRALDPRAGPATSSAKHSCSIRSTSPASCISITSISIAP
jgi:hypothetical protein